MKGKTTNNYNKENDIYKCYTFISPYVFSKCDIFTLVGVKKDDELDTM